MFSDVVEWCSDGISELSKSVGVDSGKAVHTLNTPEISQQEKIRRLENWGRERPHFEVALASMRRTVESRLDSPGYVYSKKTLKSLQDILSKFDDAIRRDDYVYAPELFDAAERAYSAFMDDCRWKKGRSKGIGTHMHSGAREGEWVADAGYEIVNGTAMRRMPCRHCNGHGYTSGQATCSRCNGACRIANPAYSGAQVANVVGGILGGLGNRRGSQFGRAIQGAGRNVPPQITCDGCNGTGRVSIQIPCGYCDSRGFNYEQDD